MYSICRLFFVYRKYGILDISNVKGTCNGGLDLTDFPVSQGQMVMTSESLYQGEITKLKSTVPSFAHCPRCLSLHYTTILNFLMCFYYYYFKQKSPDASTNAAVLHAFTWTLSIPLKPGWALHNSLIPLEF